MNFIHNIQYDDIIKQYFKNMNICQVQNCSTKFLQNNNKIKQYLQNYLLAQPQWQTIKHIIYGIVFNFQLPICKNCGKKIFFSKRRAKYCSLKCCNSNKEFLENKKQIVYKKYGYENVHQIPAVIQKTKNTINKLMQTDNTYYIERNKKRLNTIIQKYNSVEQYNKKCLQQRKITTKKQFGCEHIFQRSDVKQKIKEHHINDYGSLQEYYKNCFHNTQYFLHLGWQKIITIWKDYIIPMFSQKQYKGGQTSNQIYKWKCVKCGYEFQSKIYSTCHLKQIDPLLPRCPHCFPKHIGVSKKEIQLLDFCKQYFPNAKKSRTLIKPLEIDIVIEQIKLCIQFNGNYYHTIGKSNKIKNYHLMKTKLCNEKGYRLIHIWQDQWDNSKQLIKQKLKLIFLNKQNLEFTQNEIILERDWYNNLKIKGYELIQEIPPKIIIRNNLNVENCGYFKYKKV